KSLDDYDHNARSEAPMQWYASDDAKTAECNSERDTNRSRHTETCGMYGAARYLVDPACHGEERRFCNSGAESNAKGKGINRIVARPVRNFCRAEGLCSQLLYHHRADREERLVEAFQ